MNKNIVRVLGAGAVVGFATAANAVIDVTAATGGISDASTASLAVLAAMMALGVAVWGVKRILRFFH